MESSAKPDYYVLLQSHVRLCKKLKPIERLFFGEIHLLCNQKGYCWAGNNYFAKIYGISKRSVSRHLHHLKKLGFITINIKRDDRNMVIKRIIKIANEGIDKTVYTPSQNCLPPIDRTVQYNSTSNNNKKEKDILFNEFWDAYDKKIGRGACKKKFLKLDINICEKCVEVAYEYSESTPDIQYRKNPITWLNQECWDDEITQSRDTGRVQGGKWDGMVF